ncbi:hypothetical protein StoSoilB5_20620 [Arthrobacter sp. StoSoilB5]|nr:hypothetical protein StoSoilB5_20620 [Arthrobacter sp. StoSoilB5]
MTVDAAAAFAAVGKLRAGVRVPKIANKSAATDCFFIDFLPVLYILFSRQPRKTSTEGNIAIGTRLTVGPDLGIHVDYELSFTALAGSAAEGELLDGNQCSLVIGLRGMSRLLSGNVGSQD